MVSAWIEALREWNGKHNEGTWCIPRKGSKEQAEARAILERIKKERKSKEEKLEGGERPKKEPKMKRATPEQTEKLREALARMKSEKVIEKVKMTSKKVKVKEFLKKALEKKKAKAPIRVEITMEGGKKEVVEVAREDLKEMLAELENPYRIL